MVKTCNMSRKTAYTSCFMRNKLIQCCHAGIGVRFDVHLPCHFIGIPTVQTTQLRLYRVVKKSENTDLLSVQLSTLRFLGVLIITADDNT